ncbi:MAG TPA: F0F1 ATP synthase subunit epsilon [Candidatus Coprenecus pullistercoris]|nr:F0F1 ATP synthase subunit epsilon [Candidatus Coprenecus pullistercoris]
MMELLIVSPVRTVCKTEVAKVFFPGAAGGFEVFPGHAPLLTSLRPGNIVYTTLDGKEVTVAVRTGCVRLLDDRIEACVETAQP